MKQPVSVFGKYATAKIFTENFDVRAYQQIKELCDQPFVEGCKIRIMPDVHAGAGCVIGFTANLSKKVIPNIVGVDIGCGMLVAELGKRDIDLSQLDDVIHRRVPAGMKVHERPRSIYYETGLDLDELHCDPTCEILTGFSEASAPWAEGITSLSLMKMRMAANTSLSIPGAEILESR